MVITKTFTTGFFMKTYLFLLLFSFSCGAMAAEADTAAIADSAEAHTDGKRATADQLAQLLSLSLELHETVLSISYQVHGREWGVALLQEVKTFARSTERGNVGELIDRVTAEIENQRNLYERLFREQQQAKRQAQEDFYDSGGGGWGLDKGWGSVMASRNFAWGPASRW